MVQRTFMNKHENRYAWSPSRYAKCRCNVCGVRREGQGNKNRGCLGLGLGVGGWGVRVWARVSLPLFLSVALSLSLGRWCVVLLLSIPISIFGSVFVSSPFSASVCLVSSYYVCFVVVYPSLSFSAVVLSGFVALPFFFPLSLSRPRLFCLVGIREEPGLS